MLIGETLVVLALFDVAAGIEISADRRSDDWTPLYWVQLGAATLAVSYGVFVLWANRAVVEDLVLFFPHVMAFLVVLLPASVVLLAYAATFTLGYWSYRTAA